MGRTRELRALHDAVSGEQTFVVHVHGVAGIGKSSLVARFAHDARAAGVSVIELDGRTLEPTDRGIHDALARALGCEGATPERLYARLGEVGPRTVIVIDHYEILRLVDTWLRQVCAVASRYRPCGARQSRTAGRRLVDRVRADGCGTGPEPGRLERSDALELLRREGVEAAAAPAVERLIRPSTVVPAASAARERPDASPRVIDELSALYLDDVSDPTRGGHSRRRRWFAAWP